MATEGTFQHDGSTWTAAADLSGKQFYAVSQTAAGAVNLATTGNIVGILLNKPTSGQAADVCTSGETKAVAGSGGWTAGDTLEVDTGTGKLITQTTGNNPVGTAIDTASAGDIARCVLRIVTFA